jgi:hypothetical protein
MRQSTVRIATVLVLVAFGVLAGPVVAASGPSRAHLLLITTRPLYLKGVGFHHNERVRLDLRLSKNVSKTRHFTADAHGEFDAVFPSAKPARCAWWTVAAHGSAGSRLVVRWQARLSGCPLH